MPLWEGYAPGNRGSVYRFHLTDPVPFKKSLRVEIEHKGSQEFPDRSGSGFIERDDLMSSVAFWYQVEPHKPWPALPPGPERLAEQTLALVTGWKAVGGAKHSDHPLAVQDLPGIAKEGKQLFFTPRNDQGWVECPFQVGKDIRAHLWGKFIQSHDYGIYRVTLDGRELAVVNLYHPETRRHVYYWGLGAQRRGARSPLRVPGQGGSFHRLLPGPEFHRRGGAGVNGRRGFDLRKIQR